MLAKVTAKNRLTLPERALDATGRPTHFEIAIENGRLILTPAQVSPADAVRRKLAKLGIRTVTKEVPVPDPTLSADVAAGTAA